MPKRRKNAVIFSGAVKGDVLTGASGWKLNRGMRLRLLDDLPVLEDGGRLDVAVELLTAGDGPYSKTLKRFEGQRFDSARTLHDQVCKETGKPFLKILNGCTLELENRHFVAYHKVPERGTYTCGGATFSHDSKKSETFLQKTINGTVWVFSGDNSTGRMVYSLCSVFIPDKLVSTEEGSRVTGPGTEFVPHVTVSDLP